MIRKCIGANYIPGYSYLKNKCKHRPKGALSNCGGNGTYICRYPAKINVALEDEEDSENTYVCDISGVARRVAYEHGFKLSKGMAEKIAESFNGCVLDVSPEGEIENLHDKIDSIVRDFKRK